MGGEVPATIPAPPSCLKAKQSKKMDIRLTGALPRQLRELGLKSGDRFQNVEPAEGHRKGAVKIRFMFDDEENVAVVYPENYEPDSHIARGRKLLFRIV
jgi:hypothetical protein